MGVPCFITPDAAGRQGTCACRSPDVHYKMARFPPSAGCRTAPLPPPTSVPRVALSASCASALGGLGHTAPPMEHGKLRQRQLLQAFCACCGMAPPARHTKTAAAALPSGRSAALCQHGGGGSGAVPSLAALAQPEADRQEHRGPPAGGPQSALNRQQCSRGGPEFSPTAEMCPWNLAGQCITQSNI